MAAFQPAETLHDRSYLDELTERTISAFNQGFLSWHKQRKLTDEQLDELMGKLDGLHFDTYTDLKDWMDKYLYELESHIKNGGVNIGATKKAG